jgi:hypothetical protein
VWTVKVILISKFDREGGASPHLIPINVIGRCHGENSPYPFPNDDDEVLRLDVLQWAVKTLFGRNVLAPISKKATHILDVGTGSGCILAISIYLLYCRPLGD